MKILLLFLIGSNLIFAGCKSEKSAMTKTATSKSACFKVEGMTCVTCSATLKASVKKLKGINSIEASSDQGSAEVSYEPSVVNVSAIISSINSVGYNASERACQKNEG